MFDYELEHLFSYTVYLKPPAVIGPVPEGIRTNVYVTSGEVTGPKIYGKVLPEGGDWLILRTDGVGILDVRATFETQDEALIDVTYRGVGDLREDGYERFLRGELNGSFEESYLPPFLFEWSRAFRRLTPTTSGSTACSAWGSER